MCLLISLIIWFASSLYLALSFSYFYIYFNEASFDSYYFYYLSVFFAASLTDDFVLFNYFYVYADVFGFFCLVLFWSEFSSVYFFTLGLYYCFVFYCWRTVIYYFSLLITTFNALTSLIFSSSFLAIAYSISLVVLLRFSSFYFISAWNLLIYYCWIFNCSLNFEHSAEKMLLLCSSCLTLSSMLGSKRLLLVSFLSCSFFILSFYYFRSWDHVIISDTLIQNYVFFVFFPRLF